MTYIPLSLGDLCLAALLVVINGAISVAFRLGLERSLFWSAVRMIFQLAAIGYVLKLVFAETSPLWTAGIAIVMTLVAGYEVISRQTSPIRGLASLGLGSGTLLVVGLLTATYVTFGVIGNEPWYSPRVFLPILGMILGNSLTGIALALETLTQAAQSERIAIESRLALGHTRFQAFDGVLKRSLRTAMMPLLNAMAVSGVVSLPGMMTGQILSGVDPVEAAKYQIMIMFALSGATSLAVLATAIGGVFLLSDERQRLRLDRLATQ